MGSRLCPCVFPYFPDKICQCVFPYIISPLVSIIFVPISHVSNSFPCMFHNVFPYVPIFPICVQCFSISSSCFPMFSHMFPRFPICFPSSAAADPPVRTTTSSGAPSPAAWTAGFVLRNPPRPWRDGWPQRTRWWTSQMWRRWNVHPGYIRL